MARRSAPPSQTESTSRWPNVTLKLGPSHIEASATSASGKLTDACD